MKIEELKLTKRQLFKIREAVERHGYGEFSGKKFALLTQPVINVFKERLDIVLLTPEQYCKTVKFIKQIGLFNP